MNVKNLVLGIGIFIVSMFMLVYGIQAFYPAPQYENFCKPGQFESERFSIKTCPIGENECKFSKQLQEQANSCYSQEGFPIYDYNGDGCVTSIKKCNFCQKYFNEARISYEKTVFVIALIMGILTLLIGFFILSTEPVGSALMAAGIGAIFYGSARNWESLSNIWRFLLLLLSLIILIWIALRLNRPKKKSWQFWK